MPWNIMNWLVLIVLCHVFLSSKLYTLQLWHDLCGLISSSPLTLVKSDCWQVVVEMVGLIAAQRRTWYFPLIYCIANLEYAWQIQIHIALPI
jgi:hypothetical protein